MASYFVNDRAQHNGDHEVHREDCPYLPQIVSKTYVGEHLWCGPAVAAAKLKYPQSNGCATCSTDCHTS
ncbi:MAG: hypothetical protein F4X96_10060 [Gammaproteobacteria bacterium]|nr:hypothetical protein [Gammaproteobacteria bacterium]MYE49767.1 hypothetical protein [Gammaproteobacteria bacterium]